MRFRTRRPLEVRAAAESDNGLDDRFGVRSMVEALDALPVGVVVRDRSGRELVRNQRAASPAGDLQADALAAAAVTNALDRASGGERVVETLELHGPPARVFEITAAPLTAGGVMAIVNDMTERRHLDVVRRDFIANVNHELRTPIGALGVLAEALRDESDLGTVRRLADRVSYEADRARALIEDVLDFSRIDDRPPDEAEAVVVLDAVRDAAEGVLALAEQRGVAVRVDGRDAADDGHATVTGDRAQLVSAISNLLTNAIKYSETGGEVEVTARRTGDVVEVAVADTGVGIPAKDLERIFERFYRVDRARDRRTGGTGLGLAIVRRVAANHGGDIVVASREGEGSTFTLRLPATTGEQ